MNKLKSKQNQWKTAPLPFQGQKRFFVNKFMEALQEFPPNATYVDLFGGSGLLSHTTKYVHPNAIVVYNDFDNYSKRLEAIPETNKILEGLRSLNINTPCKQRICGIERDKVLEVLNNANEKGFVDWISISGSLLFGGNYSLSFDEFKKATFYNRIRKSNFAIADGYLDNIKVESCDYLTIFNQYKDVQNVIFLVDPPYLSTDTTIYKSDSYWQLKDYLDVVKVLDGSYFYFTSNKSQIVPLMEWIESRTPGSSPFTNATCTTVTNSISHNAKYIDIMYHYCKD